MLSVLAGFLFNVWLLTTITFRVGKSRELPIAVLGAVPAGLYDGVKVFVVGSVVLGVRLFVF